MPLNVSQAILNAARLSREAVPLIRIWPAGAAGPLGLCGGGSRSHDGVSYRGLLKVLPRGARGFDIRTHLPITGNWDLQFINGEFADGQRLSDKLAQVFNRDVEIRIRVPGLATWSSCPVLMRGRIGIPSHDDQKVTLEVEDVNTIMHRKVPAPVWPSDAADGVMLPEDSLWKVKPFVGGEHKYFYGHTSDPANTTSLQGNNLVKAIDLGLDAAGRRRWQLSSHELANMVTDESDSDTLWALHSGLGRKVEIAAFDVEQNNANGCIISVATDVTYYDYIYGDTTSSGDSSSGAFWNGFDRVNDKILTTYAEAVHTTDQEFPDDSDIDADFSGYVALGDMTITEVRVFSKAYWDKQATITVGDIVFSVNFKVIPTAISQATVAIVDCDTLAASEAGANASVQCRFYKLASDGDHEARGRIYEVWKRVSFKSDENLPVLLGGQGIEWGTEINGRSTTEGYSATHADDDGEGDLIESGAGMIEKVYRELVDRNAEHLDENQIGASPTKWAKTGSFLWDASGALLNFPITSDLNGTIKQTAANRLLAGKPFTTCVLKYSVGVTTVPDGDFEMFLPAGGFAEEKTILPHTAGIHLVPVVLGSGGATADVVIQSSETTSTQGVLSINNIYLESDDLDLDSFNVASNDGSGIKLAPGIVKQIKSDKLVGRLGLQSRLYPWVQPNGTIKVQAILDEYSSEDIVISLDRAKFVNPPAWTPLSWLNTRVRVLYDWNGERYLGKTSYAQDTAQQDYYNVTANETTKDLECPDIHELASAGAARDWWLAQWKQLHIQFPLWVPLDYFHVDAGDIVRLTDAPYKYFNEDITVDHYRSGQTIYKYFLATKVEPWIDGSVLHLFNLHNLTE